MQQYTTKPMTKDEALQILNIEEPNEEEPLNHEHVMERFETLFEKNRPENHGSFYLQSKIYFAKQHLMMDFPEEFNKSKFNPGEQDGQEASEEDKATEDDNKKEEPKK